MGIMAQRLVRKVCPKCRQRYEPPPHTLQSLGLRPELAKKANFMKGKGCTYCGKSGYRGRMGIYELMAMTNTIREMTFKGEPTQVLRKAARKQGMRTLFEDGMIKAMKGLTTIDEVLRITHHEIAGRRPAEPSSAGGRRLPSRRASLPAGRTAVFRAGGGRPPHRRGPRPIPRRCGGKSELWSLIRSVWAAIMGWGQGLRALALTQISPGPFRLTLGSRDKVKPPRQSGRRAVIGRGLRGGMGARWARC